MQQRKRLNKASEIGATAYQFFPTHVVFTGKECIHENSTRKLLIFHLKII